MQIVIIRTLGWIMVAPVCGWCEEPLSLREVTLTVLHAQLKRPDIGFSTDVLDQIAEETGLSTGETRDRLLGLVDSLDYHRERETSLWRAILADLEGEVASKAANDFLKRVLSESRKILMKQKEFSLRHVIKRIAMKSKLPMTGEVFLIRVLGVGLAKNVVPRQSEEFLIGQMPEVIDVFVEVQDLLKYAEGREVMRNVLNNPRGHVPAAIFFRTNDVDVITEKYRDGMRSLLPVLARKVTQSPHVGIATQQPTSKLKPAYSLRLEVSGLFVSFGPGERAPCIRARVALRHIGTEMSLWEKDLNRKNARSNRPGFHFCSGKFSSGNTSSLDGFMEEVAELTVEELEGFLRER